MLTIISPLLLIVKIKNLPQEIQDLIQNNAPTDFILVVEGKEITVYETVLIHYSPVFAALFERQWKETTERKCIIPDFSYKIVKIAMEILYGKMCGEYLIIEEIVSLYQFADKYDMQILMGAVKERTIHTPFNVCEFLTVAFERKCDNLVTYCIDYIKSCFQNEIKIDVGYQNQIKFIAGYKNQIKVNGFLLLSNEIKLNYLEECFKNLKFHYKREVNNVQSIKLENVPQNIKNMINVEKEFTLETGYFAVKVHKAVLIHYSSSFGELFQKEKFNGKYSILSKFPHKIVQIAIDILYGQKYVDALTEEEVVLLLQFAHLYGFVQLEANCC
uniref:BTB domain-containing protein n=1 Tax=Panagrolaimus sp. ES5 TaxID=591445 RepID=A0AC34FBC4_9BILA